MTTSLQINLRKSQLAPTRRITFLGMEIDLDQTGMRLSSSARRKMMTWHRHLATHPELLQNPRIRQQMAGFHNFYARHCRLPQCLVQLCLLGSPLAIGLHALYPTTWITYRNPAIIEPVTYTDATPTQIAIIQPAAGLALTYSHTGNQYYNEYLALFSAMAHGASHLATDNLPALLNLRRGKLPLKILLTLLPAGLRWFTVRFRQLRLLHVPSDSNPADAFSRLTC